MEESIFAQWMPSLVYHEKGLQALAMASLFMENYFFCNLNSVDQFVSDSVQSKELSALRICNTCSV